MDIKNAIINMENDLKELEHIRNQCNSMRRTKTKSKALVLDDKIEAMRLVLASAKVLHQDTPVLTELNGETWANFDVRLPEETFERYGLAYASQKTRST